MSQFGKELKTYAESGLRSAKDWRSIGREVEDGSTPRANLASHGEAVALYTRDQTQQFVRVRREK